MMIKWGDIGSWKGQWTWSDFSAVYSITTRANILFLPRWRRDGLIKIRWKQQNGDGFRQQPSAGICSRKNPCRCKMAEPVELRASYGIRRQPGDRWIPQSRFMGTERESINPETGKRSHPFKAAWNANPDWNGKKPSEVKSGSRLLHSLTGRFKRSWNGITRRQKTFWVNNSSCPPNWHQKTFANSGSLF